MKKLDWYILKKFISTFFFSIFLFAVIAVVIDVSEKADDFVKSQLSASRIITDYYFGFIPHIIALLFPLFIFIAVIFFTSKMAGRSEIIAILASGTPFNRWLRPYLIGGVFLASILWLANQYVVPNANKIRGAFEATYVDRNSSYENLVNHQTTTYYLRIDSFTYAGMYNYDTVSKQGGTFFMYKIKNNRVIENTRATNISWDAAKNAWKLNNVFDRKIAGIQEQVATHDEQYMKFAFKPSDLNRDKYTKDKLTSPELRRFIELEKARGSENLNELIVELERRNATPVTVILLTLIGAVVAGRKVRGGSGSHLAVGFVTAALFILADRFSTTFATKGNLSPVLAAWIPNIIFLFVAYFLYKKAPK